MSARKCGCFACTHPNEVDRQARKLVHAFNRYLRVETCSSCHGHVIRRRGKYYIYSPNVSIHTTKLSDLRVVLEAITGYQEYRRKDEMGPAIQTDIAFCAKPLYIVGHPLSKPNTFYLHVNFGLYPFGQGPFSKRDLRHTRYRFGRDIRPIMADFADWIKKHPRRLP